MSTINLSIFPLQKLPYDWVVLLYKNCTYATKTCKVTKKRTVRASLLPRLLSVEGVTIYTQAMLRWMYSPPEAWNFIKKETPAQVFSCGFYRISKNIFFHRTPLVAASADPKVYFGLYCLKLFINFIKKLQHRCFVRFKVRFWNT